MVDPNLLEQKLLLSDRLHKSSHRFGAARGGRPMKTAPYFIEHLFNFWGAV